MGISMSYVELYNGRLFDLLVEATGGERQEIKLLEDAQNNVLLQFLTLV